LGIRSDREPAHAHAGLDFVTRLGRAAAICIVVLLVCALVAAAIQVDRLRDERDAARFAVVAANESLSTSNDALLLTRKSSSRRLEIVRGLRGQVEWDKSHLLDCWTALVRVVPGTKMKAIFGRPLGYLAEAARDGGVLAHYVRRCAADAVP